MRLFFAFPLTHDMRKRLFQRSRASLDSRLLRLTDDEHLHMTVCFLGERDEQEIPSLISEAEQLLGTFSSFEIRLGNLSAFPMRSEPRTIVADVDMGSDACRSIIKAFDSHFTGRSNKRIHPHVTVARVRNKKSYDRWKLSEVSRITSDLGCRIDTVVLFSSRLERSGAVYTPLHTIRL